MKKVLFVGDINVDVMMGGLESEPIVDREITCTSYEVKMGSTAVVCACAYAALGGEAALAGLAGNDEYGAFMLRGLAERNVNTELVRRTGKVKTGVTVNLIHGKNRTQVTYPGTIAEFGPEHIDEAALEAFDHIHFAGPYLQTRLRPHITRWLQHADARGATTSLDPQWDSAETWEFMQEWCPLLSYLFVNTDEARSITEAGSPEQACRKLAARTLCPVVKAGEQGCLVSVDGAVRTIPAKKVQIVDTTGAGDCFDAAVLYAQLERGMALEEAVAFANAAGARSCLFVGGVDARSSYEDVIRFMRRT